MYALGVVGEAEDVARLVALAPRKQDSEDLALPYAARETLRTSTATLLRRNPRAWPALASTLRTVDPSAAKILLDALGCARDPRALGILLETARTNRDLAWKAISLVPSCGSSLNAQTDREVLEWVRSELQNAPPNYARTLLMAVGTLDDGDWVPTLIEKLGDEDSGLREEALTALRRISGLGFPGDPVPWCTWLAAETRWHTQQRPQLEQQLSSAETPRVLSAIREYSEHRTRRAEMAQELVKVLEHPKWEVRSLVISVLERLGSPAACGALMGMMDDDDSKVAEAAWHALYAISGIELPRDADQLRELFGRT